MRKRTLADGTVSWQARWRDPDGEQRGRQFKRKADATRHVAQQEVDLANGSYLDRNAGQITFAEWELLWRPVMVALAESTRQHDESLIRCHIVKRWGKRAIGSIKPYEVQAWASSLTGSPSSVKATVRIFSKIMKAAVRSRRIAFNPVEEVKTPAVVQRDVKSVTVEDVLRLSSAIPSPYGAFVLLLGFCGLRYGEAAALRWSCVDLERGTVEVKEAVYELNDGTIITTPGKTKAARRTVPLPAIVIEALAKLQTEGPDADALVFPTAERRSNFRSRIWNPAAKHAGMKGITPHDLRRFAASLWISEGGDPVECAKRFGHTSARLMLDLYAQAVDTARVDTLTPALDRLIAKPTHEPLIEKK